VKVYTCCCKIFKGLTFFWTQCSWYTVILDDWYVVFDTVGFITWAPCCKNRRRRRRRRRRI